MENLLNNKKNTFSKNKLQHKLIVLISTLKYVNITYKKYTQKNILYYFNENLKRNGQNPIKLKTLQNYLYKLEKELKITTNYYKHLGVNCGTEIYYKLNYSKKECYQKINKYFEEKKLSRFEKRVDNHLRDKFTKDGNVNLEECLNNKNNNIKEERTNKIEKYKKLKYFNKCNFFDKKTLSNLLKLDINIDSTITIFKTVKKHENSLAKSKHISFNKSCLKKKQSKLKEILENIQKQFEKKGYNPKQLEKNIKKIYENYKNKPHFIIEHQKYNDLSAIKRKLEKSIERKKENPSKNNKKIKENIFNILIENLKKEKAIEVLNPIVKSYLNDKKILEYNKIFDIYRYELLEIIKR
ncbi:plasmid maintenance protein (plasmid) [Borreliella yangtzensis]|uniref:plasmid maintenance protein n=2 Tax=Borreliella TaxID=64895 RepID=UPI003B21BC3C